MSANPARRPAPTVMQDYANRAQNGSRAERIVESTVAGTHRAGLGGSQAMKRPPKRNGSRAIWTGACSGPAAFRSFSRSHPAPKSARAAVRTVSNRPAPDAESRRGGTRHEIAAIVGDAGPAKSSPCASVSVLRAGCRPAVARASGGPEDTGLSWKSDTRREHGPDTRARGCPRLLAAALPCSKPLMYEHRIR